MSHCNICGRLIEANERIYWNPGIEGLACGTEIYCESCGLNEISRRLHAQDQKGISSCEEPPRENG
jgi:hypothetical protein